MSEPQPPDIERILFTEEQIQQRIREVAAEISEKYRGRDLKLIGVLKGSVFFLTALAREIEIPVKIDFLAISSFSNQRGAPGVVRIAKDLDESIEGEDVLLVEDIVDTGFTARYLLQTLAGRGPELARDLHAAGPHGAPHRAGSGRVPLLRDPGPLRDRLRPGLQAALPEPGLHRRDEAGLIPGTGYVTSKLAAGEEFRGYAAPEIGRYNGACPRLPTRSFRTTRTGFSKS